MTQPDHSDQNESESKPSESHDHNFKNLFLDFPKEALRWLMPEIPETWGELKGIDFLRQEPKKWKLGHSHLSLDMPILFTFEKEQLLLWLVEFQEDKQKFSIHRLLRYTADYMELRPDAVVIPCVLFTDRKKWRKQPPKSIETRFAERVFLHFEYVFVRLFDFHARNYYNSPNPLVRILLPKMSHTHEERMEVIRHAYSGLFQLAPMLFDKYVDFIDTYAEIREAEREDICKDMFEKKETAMLAQYIREKGMQQGMQQGMRQGMQQGIQQGIQQGKTGMLIRLLEARFGRVPGWAKKKIEIADLTEVEKWCLRLLDAKNIEEVFNT